MCRLRNIAMHDYQKSVTTGQTDRQTDAGQSDPYVPLCFAGNTKTLLRTSRPFFLSSFVEFRLAVSEEKSKMLQPIRGHGGHLVFLISLENTKLVKDVEILLPVKFHCIQFSGFR